VSVVKRTHGRNKRKRLPGSPHNSDSLTNLGFIARNVHRFANFGVQEERYTD